MSMNANLSSIKIPVCNTRGSVFCALIGALLCLATACPAAQELPPLPKGVSELKFSEFFVNPIGPGGLELTEKLTALDGRRVRILGHMVRQEHATKGWFLLTLVPVQVHDHDSSDDLPPACVRVHLPSAIEVGYTPQLLLLTGRLSVGNREESDGRISMVRLSLDESSLRKSNRISTPARPTRGGAQNLMR
jgi:hypothetical protein